MGDAISGVLPAAVGVMLSPIPIVAVILMLGTPKAKTNGPAFGLGWILGLTAVSALVLALTSGADTPDSTSSDGTNSTLVVLGVVLLVVAVRQWRKRPGPGEEPELPSWMATVDSFAAPKSFALGILASAVNPKNLALTAAAAASVSLSGADAEEAAAAMAVFVVIASLSVVGPVVLYLVAGDRVAPKLEGIKTTMAGHNNVIMAVICLVLGAKLIADGSGGLF